MFEDFKIDPEVKDRMKETAKGFGTNQTIMLDNPT